MPLRALSLFVAALAVVPSVAFPQPPNGQGRGQGASAAARAAENRQPVLGGHGSDHRPAMPSAGTIGRDRADEHRPDHVGPQLGTGRLGRESESRREFGLGRRLDRPTSMRDERSRFDDAPAARREDRAEREPGWNRLAVTQGDRLLATRLAQIDKMRDLAVQTANESLLERADELEHLARRQHARRNFESDVRDRNGLLPLRPVRSTANGEGPEAAGSVD